jgi:hypothetical protein
LGLHAGLVGSGAAFQLRSAGVIAESDKLERAVR